MERSGSKKSRAAEAAPALQFRVPSLQLFWHPLCVALLSRWLAIVSAITSTFQEVEWRERRKNKFTSFQKISWKVHTSHLVDSHWLEHWHMAAPAAKCVGRYSFLLQVTVCLSQIKESMRWQSRQWVGFTPEPKYCIRKKRFNPGTVILNVRVTWVFPFGN